MERANNSEFAFSGERQKNPSEKLKVALARIAEAVNKTAAESGLRNLLKPDCSLDMDGYALSKGGIYKDADVALDQAKVKKLEKEFSGANSPGTQNHYKTQYGIATPEGIVERWKQNKARDKNGQMEMATMVMLHKMLKDRYIVVRTAELDDFEHGADNIIIDIQTGAAVAAYDEVHESGSGERLGLKQKRILDVAKWNGATIRYGLSVNHRKLQRSSVRNVPLFYLALDSGDLKELLENMDFDPDSAPTPAERKMFGKLVESLREQKQMMDNAGLPAWFKKKITAFGLALDQLEKSGAAPSRAAAAEALAGAA